MQYEAPVGSPDAAPRVMVLRVEPTGYMLALTRALREAWPGPIDVVFMARALTQPWDTDEATSTFHILPQGRLRPIVALRKYIAATGPRLLHAAGWSAPPSLAAILTGKGQRLPVVVDLDTWRGTPSRWRWAAKQAVYPRLFRRVTHFAPGGQRQAAYLRSFGVADSKITPVNMTVDVTTIRATLAREPDAGRAFRVRFGIPADAPMALFMGRLVALKGIGDLLAAWSQVVAETPSAKLAIAGDGDLRSHVAAAAAADPSILPIGRLSGAEVWRAYTAADYVVAPSHGEGWGLIVNEAMAAGTPVIVTDVFGCVGDLARDDDTALVVPPASPEQLAQAMQQLARDPALRSRLARKASTLISNWTIEAEAQKIVGIWRRVLAEQGAARAFRRQGV